MCGNGITQKNVKKSISRNTNGGIEDCYFVRHVTELNVYRSRPINLFTHNSITYRYFETKGMLGIKAVKRYVVLDKRKLEIHKGQNESTKILSTIMLEQDKFRVRKTRGKTKNTVNAIEIGEMNSADATIMFAAPNTFQQQDWYEELCKIVNEWKEDVWEEKKEEEIVQVRPATPSDAEEDEAFAPTKKTTTTTTTTENIFQSSLDDEDDGGDDALDDW